MGGGAEPCTLTIKSVFTGPVYSSLTGIIYLGADGVFRNVDLSSPVVFPIAIENVMKNAPVDISLSPSGSYQMLQQGIQGAVSFSNGYSRYLCAPIETNAEITFDWGD